MAAISSVSIIGSFRQYYPEVQRAWGLFCGAGLTVTSPKGTCILEEGIPFVRFESDDSEWPDELVQTVALHRILRADFVFVVVPEGYIGRTTCYEIGRIVQAKQPIYFSQKPKDLPIVVPSMHIAPPEEIVQRINAGQFNPGQIHISISGMTGELERDLIDGVFSEL